ncbi:MAG: response regulator transcription factor [Candidatus Melainabacteria bacterium]|nr:response regulator transcription factor [Candidatus Melainabacteria bacterium]
MAKVLVVEDDEDFAMTLVDGLSGERHTVEHVLDGDEAVDLLKVAEFDVIVLDWQLPSMSGIEVIRSYRASGGKTPIIMLTGKGEIRDKETGLDTGADDYLTKPFDLRELSARIRALLRRRSVETSNTLRVGDLELDPTRHRLSRSGKELHLPPRDFALLEFFLRHPGEVFSAEALLARVWHTDSEASSEGLRASIRRIRKVVDEGDDLSTSIIENISRVGYRLRS